MQKSVTLLVLITLTTALAFAGGQTESGTGEQPTTITMWTFLDINKDSPREVALRRIIENFHADNPDVRVNVESQVWNTMPTKFFMGHETGDAPDISWINTANLGALVQTGAGADLNELFIDSWTNEEEQDFFIRAGWDATLVDGSRYSVPLFHSSQVLFYRADLFEEAGIDPDGIRTWDQLIDAAKALTEDTNGDGVVDQWGLGIPLSVEKADTNPFLYSLLELNDGVAFDECVPQYTTDAGVRSLELQASFVEEGVTPQESLAYSSDDIVDQFIAGKYAIINGPFVRYKRIQDEATWDGAQLKVMRWPNWTPERYGPVTVKGWWAAVWRDSPNVEAAGRFLEHMISPESVEIWATVGGQVPTRMSVMEDPMFQADEFDYMWQLVNGWEDWSWLNPVSCNMSGYEADISEATHKYLLEDADALAVLQEAEQKFIDRQ